MKLPQQLIDHLAEDLNLCDASVAALSAEFGDGEALPELVDADDDTIRSFDFQSAVAGSPGVETYQSDAHGRYHKVAEGVWVEDLYSTNNTIIVAADSLEEILDCWDNGDTTREEIYAAWGIDPDRTTAEVDYPGECRIWRSAKNTPETWGDGWLRANFGGEVREFESAAEAQAVIDLPYRADDGGFNDACLPACDDYEVCPADGAHYATWLADKTSKAAAKALIANQPAMEI